GDGKGGGRVGGPQVGGEGGAGQHGGTHHQRRRTTRAATGEEQVILPDQMLGIRPGRLRTHRKAQRRRWAPFRATTMHQYFSATNFLPVNDAVSSTACPLACRDR